MSTLGNMILRDLASAIPTAGIPGRIFIATDTGEVSRDNGTTWDQITVLTLSGTTGSRPTVTGIAYPYFDTTLNKPIWWNGTNWVDATGTTV